MILMRRSIVLLAALAFVGALAAEAFARGGGPGGGGRGGPGGGGRGGMGGGMRGGMGGRMGGGRTGGMGGQGGFGMRGNRNAGGQTAKEAEVLQNIEERKAMLVARRERLMELDRKLQQEAYLASVRLERAVGASLLPSRKEGAAR